MKRMTVGAVMADLAAELKYLGDWHRFPGAAVLISGGFLKSVAETMGKFRPQIQVRTFRPTSSTAPSTSPARSIPAK